MINTCKYNSPIGKLTLISKNNKLIGVYTNLHKNTFKIDESTEKEDEILIKTKKWLDRYFNEEKPKIDELNIEFIGSEFRKNVWKLLCEIPYGEITTYKILAKKIEKLMNIPKMSAQAIRNAVSKNPIGIIVPCHRVVGTNGNLTGYISGIDIKIKLLKLEKVDITKLWY